MVAHVITTIPPSMTVMNRLARSISVMVRFCPVPSSPIVSRVGALEHRLLVVVAPMPTPTATTAAVAGAPILSMMVMVMMVMVIVVRVLGASG